MSTLKTVWTVNCTKTPNSEFTPPSIDPVEGTVFFFCGKDLVEYHQLTGKLLNTISGAAGDGVQQLVVTPKEFLLVQIQTCTIYSRSGSQLAKIWILSTRLQCMTNILWPQVSMMVLVLWLPLWARGRRSDLSFS